MMEAECYEDKGVPLFELAGKFSGWRCLGRACPSSCCYNTYGAIFADEVIPLSKYFPVAFCGLDKGAEGFEIRLCILMTLVRYGPYCSYLQDGIGCVLGGERPLTCKRYPFTVLRLENGGFEIRARSSCQGFGNDISSIPLLSFDGSSISKLLMEECELYPERIINGRERTVNFENTVFKLGLLAQVEHKGIPFKIIKPSKYRSLPESEKRLLEEAGFDVLIDAHFESFSKHCPEFKLE